MDNLTRYYSYLSEKIKQENNYGINEIVMIESKGTFIYTVDGFNEIKKALILNKPFPLHNSDAVNELRQYLDVFFIEDQLARKFSIIVYDSDEFSQDPEIVEILPISNQR